MPWNASAAPYDRVVERRRAIALARHFRDGQGLSIPQIDDRLGRSPATTKAGPPADHCAAAPNW